jgi:ABC-type lipoprotein export system ATPase subunit
MNGSPVAPPLAGTAPADEPTGALHSEDKARVIALFRQLNRAGHATVMVTHDPEMAALADRRTEIRDGVLHAA